METLIVQLRLPKPTAFDDDTRAKILNSEGTSILPPNKAEEAWGSTVPSSICLTAKIQESAIFIAKDWVVTVRSQKLIDCVAGIFAFMNVLGRELNTPVEIELPDTGHHTPRPLHNQLDRERKTRQLVSIGVWVIAILAGGVLSVALSWMFWGGP